VISSGIHTPHPMGEGHSELMAGGSPGLRRLTDAPVGRPPDDETAGSLNRAVALLTPDPGVAP
jgi:hypothetical protein